MPDMEDIARLLQSLLSAENSGSGENTAADKEDVNSESNENKNINENIRNSENNDNDNNDGSDNNKDGSFEGTDGLGGAGGFGGLGGLEALFGLFGGLGGQSGESNSNSSENSFFAGIDLDMIMKMGMLFARFQQPDKNTALLTALKPIMKNENQTKIDTAMKLVRIMGLLPYLRESGFLDKLF